MSELKFQDHSFETTVDSAGSVFTLANLVQGTSQSMRIGREATYENIFMRCTLQMPSGTALAAPNGDVGRVILYIDHQANGAVAAITDLLAEVDYQSFYNVTNEKRFTVLLDRTVALNYIVQVSENFTGDGGVYPKLDKKFMFNLHREILVEYSGPDGVKTELRSNNIGLMLIGKSDAMEAIFQIRMRFRG